MKTPSPASLAALCAALGSSLAASFVACPARADGAPAPAPSATQDQSQAAPPKPEEKESTLPFRKSVFFLDQSMSTQTVGVGAVPQTYTPVYEWWISFRPRYYFSDKLFATLRMDYFKEFTNSDNGRTNYREDVFDDVWTGLTYETPIDKRELTKVRGGALFRWPLSKQSQGEGVYVKAGATTGIKQKIPIHGENDPFLNDVHLNLSAWYEHPFTQATTATATGFSYTRQDTEGRSFVTDQVSGTTIVDHQLMISAEAALQITPKLDFSTSIILINQWHYAPTANVTVPVAGGSASVPRSADDQQFTQNSWLLATVDYDLLDEVSLALGYYNLQNYLSPQGQHRTAFGSDNIWWSPDARFFFTVTLNIDSLYQRLAHNEDVKSQPSFHNNYTSAKNAIQQQMQFDATHRAF